MIILKKDSARKLPVLLVDSGGAVQASVGEGDVTVATSKNGGVLAGFTLTDKWTELGQGLYTIDFASGDLDTEGFFAYLVTVTGCDQYSGIMYVSDWETNVDSILEDTNTTLPAAITTAEGNIRGTDSDTLKTLSEQVDGVQTDATAIKEKTDNLPTDPADESLLEAELLLVETNVKAAITDAEGNIRGGGDDLNTLSGQLDTIHDALVAIKGVGWTDENLTTIDSLIDAIKDKTDNLPTDPADQSLLEAAITVVDNNLANLAIDIVMLLSADITAALGVLQGEHVTIQADLDDPDQYKADVAALALEATLTDIKGAGWTTETLVALQAAIDIDVLGNLTILDTKINAAALILDYLRQKESGRWKIANDQLTYYEDDGVTVLKQFNLFNKEGRASNENPYERVPV